jgi:flagellar secretion chaperone FliS
MSTTQSSVNQYQQAQIATADRGQLLVLIYDGGLRFLARAEKSLEDGDLTQFGHFLGRAQAIIAELLHTLDHKNGGEIATNLERLYRFMLEHLVEANLQKSPRHVADVRRILGIVAGAYREIVANGKHRSDALHAA